MGLNLLRRIKAAATVMPPPNEAVKETLEATSLRHRERRSVEAVSILDRLVAGTVRLADVMTSTETIFAAIECPAGVDAAVRFVTKFPNRLWVGAIPEFIRLTDRQEIGDIYLHRLLSDDFAKPTWQAPEWTKAHGDTEDFFYAVQGLLAALLGLGAGEDEFKNIAGFLKLAYADRMESDDSLWGLVDSVHNKGKYHLPNSSSNQRGGGHKKPFPDSKFTSPGAVAQEDASYPAGPNGTAIMATALERAGWTGDDAEVEEPAAV